MRVLLSGDGPSSAQPRHSAHPTTVTDRTRYVVAAVIAGVGLVFMVGNLFWAFAGIVLLALAIGYGVWPRLRRR
jgi:hypothetical protein